MYQLLFSSVIALCSNCRDFGVFYVEDSGLIGMVDLVVNAISPLAYSSMAPV